MGHIVNIQVAYMKKYVDLVRDSLQTICLLSNFVFSIIYGLEITENCASDSVIAICWMKI